MHPDYLVMTSYIQICRKESEGAKKVGPKTPTASLDKLCRTSIKTGGRTHNLDFMVVARWKRRESPSGVYKKKKKERRNGLSDKKKQNSDGTKMAVSADHRSSTIPTLKHASSLFWP